MPAGRLGDLWSRRDVFLAALAIAATVLTPDRRRADRSESAVLQAGAGA